MLLMVLVAIGVIWTFIALVVVGLCSSAARADARQSATPRPASGGTSRPALRLIA
ncbi:hypothetical protein C8N24_3964 [Solirubrobacter pauli]|uniref:Uncharacterized protein n=1 Tax=Solirubrobacter pauli TaxID=166793 RepID=A0A660LG26_9ACTN|nr:hypothetical protein [Solirubrobacter pauli]RKQ94087.1 hypothetical protein C8N24_3964 [Solirubrobacter pauli]